MNMYPHTTRRRRGVAGTPRQLGTPARERVRRPRTHHAAMTGQTECRSVKGLYTRDFHCFSHEHAKSIRIITLRPSLMLAPMAAFWVRQRTGNGGTSDLALPWAPPWLWDFPSCTRSQRRTEDCFLDDAPAICSVMSVVAGAICPPPLSA